jgi:hypothetical protein
MALSFTLLASTQVHANDCEAKAAQVVSTLGATIEERSSMRAEVNRHEIRYECALLPEGEGSFAISIFRDAAKQKEVDRQFENSMAQLRVKNKAKQ